MAIFFRITKRDKKNVIPSCFISYFNDFGEKSKIDKKDIKINLKTKRYGD